MQIIIFPKVMVVLMIVFEKIFEFNDKTGERGLNE